MQFLGDLIMSTKFDFNSVYFDRVKEFMSGETPDSLVLKNPKLSKKNLVGYYRVFVELMTFDHTPNMNEIMEISNSCKVPSIRVVKTWDAIIKYRKE